MGATWSSKWVSTATAFHGNSGQFKPKHERVQRGTIFEFIESIRDTESLVQYLQKNDILPDDENLNLRKYKGKNGDQLNEGYKFHVLRSKPSQ